MCIGITLGTIYEISEFIGGTIYLIRILLNQPEFSQIESADLIGDLIGAVIAGIHVSIKNLVGGSHFE